MNAAVKKGLTSNKQAANIIRVYIGENSYKAFACKDKTRLEELKPQILEKFEIPIDQIDKYGIYERKGDNGAYILCG